MANENSEINEITYGVIRVKAWILAFAFAVFGGLSLFIMTVLLLIKGGPNVGQHLKLLSNFYWGYDVTWFGSIVGFFYGALTGWIVGWLIGVLYNFIVTLRTSQK